MATAFIRFGSTLAAVVNRTPKPKRVILKQVEGRLVRGVRRSPRKFEFPFGPKEVRYEGEGIDYINIERPGLVSLLEADSTKARTISFTAIIADVNTGGRRSVESSINLLNAMAKEDIDLTFVYGVRSLSYRVRITNLSTDSVQRDLSGNITQATMSIQLTERPRRTIDPITLNAIRYTPASKPPKKKTKTTSSSTKPSSNTTSKPHINTDPIVNSPIGGGGGGGGSRITIT